MKALLSFLLALAASALAESFSVSMNDMEPPRAELEYSSESPLAGDTLFLRITVPPGWHINSNLAPDDFLVPSRIEAAASGMEFGEAAWPAPQEVFNDILKINLLLLQDSFSIALPIKSIADGYNPYNAKINFTYQACSKICLAPKTIEVAFGGMEREEKKNSAAAESIKPIKPIEQHSANSSLPIYILFAFLGGMILNMMPCVLPVLFIKVFDIAKRGGASRGALLKWGFSTALGIFVSFAAIASLVLALRAGGEAIGWGFQFQRPEYIAALALLVALFALNLWGVFEIWLPGAAFGGLEKQAKKHGEFAGAFAHGVLLVLLSTPCSAPFLGAAAGFAMAAPAPALLSIFFALAAGLSMPYILLSAFPGWARLLPRPGRWMEVFRQFLGFPLLLTLAWLFWVFFRQAGEPAAISFGILLCMAAFFAWLSGLLASPGKPWARFALLWAVFLALCVLLWSAWIKPQIGSGASAREEADSEWIPFSQSKLDSLQNAGVAVWLNATADWCINCKVNERGALASERARQAFAQARIAKMRLDYTAPNEEAAKLLKSYGRSGVPFDLLLNSRKEAILLPELLYPDTIVKALEGAYP